MLSYAQKKASVVLVHGAPGEEERPSTRPPDVVLVAGVPDVVLVAGVPGAVLVAGVPDVALVAGL